VDQFEPLPVRERVLGAAEHIGFKRAERKFFKERLHSLGIETKSQVLAPGVSSRFGEKRPHVVVVPHEGESFDSFAPGNRNFYYEAAQSMREMYGSDSVSLFHVDPGEHPEQWHKRLLSYLLASDATHILCHVESDPGQDGATWTWDQFWARASRRWDGVLLGVMFDSSFKWLAAQSRLLARISPRFLLVDICIPMDGRMVRGRSEVGPVNMPISHESLALLDARLVDVRPSVDVSFIGAMYPYRVDLIQRLRSMGISIAVNPHRPEPAEDFVTSRSNQPSWLDYMAGLASSRMTLNFSQSSAGRFVQLKTRVLEAGLAGTLLLTDDVDRTSRFFTPNVEYGYFRNLDVLPSVISEYLDDLERLSQTAVAGSNRARDLAPTSFWHSIGVGLARRKLPSVARRVSL